MAPREVRGLLGSQGGMLRLPQGAFLKMAQTQKNWQKHYKGRAEAAGYSVSVDKSTRSPSRYVNIDKYPNGDAGLQPKHRLKFDLVTIRTITPEWRAV